ncbi:MAG: protein kinase [Planctomycetes bacterium]|nr:protein kinase [Planctomycetota bacterium]
MEVILAHTPMDHAEHTETEYSGLLADLREAFGSGTSGVCQPRVAYGGVGRGGSSADNLGGGPAELPPGTRIGDFEIVNELGRGGMGIVYRARQKPLNRLVALKVLPAAMWRGRAAIKRFQREAQAAARLNHANVVPVYAQGENDGSYYYAMKLVEGVTLDTAIRTVPEILSSRFVFDPTDSGASVYSEPSAASATLAADSKTTEAEEDHLIEDAPIEPPRRSVEDFRHLARLVAGVADGLDHAHHHGVIHRDIKPQNLILENGQRLCITDFGLAQLADEPQITLPGEIMGTPAYLSPEQVRGNGGKVDHRTDVYSLGVTLYELITNQRPFSGDTREQTLDAIRTIEPRRPRQWDSRIPLDLETICLRAMEKEPVRRYPTAEAMSEDLRRFADGRPILSRRAGVVEKAIKWSRRHQGASAAIVTTAIAVVALAGWTISVSIAARRTAAELVRGSFEQLVFNDYRKPELVEEDLRRAEELGARGPQLVLAKALACMGRSDQAGALEYLRPLLAEDPTNIPARYVEAWAHWRDGDITLSRGVFDEAEELGGPQTPEDWFLRGLAVHYDDPALAIESYRQANALRAVDHGFFPQAILHLARAHNQLMYTTRAIEDFREARDSLAQLIANGYYDAYPHYLLSIAYRLAGEIYAGSTGVRGEDISEEYFAEALDWAREGQKVDPSYDYPVMAEAECLEQMGRFAEAVDARTRAIVLATTDRGRCEEYHYRWRLHYWLGNYDEALSDIAEHAACEPHSPFYAHFYPALVYAEKGDFTRALADARALAEFVPGSPRMVLLSAACLRLLGKPAEAEELLRERIDTLIGLEAPEESTGISDTLENEWIRDLYAFSMGTGALDSLMELVDEADEPWRLQGEASFHAGAKALAAGRRNEARAHFLDAYRSFDGAMNYTFHAGVICERMKSNAEWPSWVPAVGNDGPG